MTFIVKYSVIMAFFVFFNLNLKICVVAKKNQENFVNKNCRFVDSKFVKTCRELVFGLDVW